MEGKEVRFGIGRTRRCSRRSRPTPRAARSTRCTTASTPLGGLVPLVNIKLGEVVFGGVGAGLYGMLVFVVLTVFIAGLMVGRTPEYLGKKIEAREMKLAMLYVLIFPLIILGFSGWSAVAPYGAAIAEQRRAARPHRDPLCLHQRRRQQRLGLRRPQRQHALVEHHARADHARRALLR